MAHHGGHGGVNESAIADRVGLFTTLIALGGYVMVIVLLVKQPKIAIPAVLIAFAFTVGIGPDPMQHPLIGLAAMCMGASLIRKGTHK